MIVKKPPRYKILFILYNKGGKKMLYLYIALIILILIFIIIFFCYLKRKKWAIKKVNCMSDEQKVKKVNNALSPFGFEFCLEQDIVISKNNPWQRDVGYHDLYDLKSPLFNIIMDCEPIYFDYNHKHYRMEFWKGQYGITTGAEIGLYVLEDNHHKYRAATDEERLNMSFVLFKKCFLFSRCDLSWWLTGFDVGLFSKPKDLKLRACINFPNQEMQIAFVEGLLNAGYTKNKIDICYTEVCFNICEPLNYKLNYRHKLIKLFIQIINYLNCSIYMFITRYFNRTIDKLTYLILMAPHLYKLIIRLTFPKKRCKKFTK